MDLTWELPFFRAMNGRSTKRGIATVSCLSVRSYIHPPVTIMYRCYIDWVTAKVITQNSLYKSLFAKMAAVQTLKLD